MSASRGPTGVRIDLVVRARAGFAIGLVLAILSVLGVVVFSYQIHARNRARVTHRFLFAETAHHLSLGGIRAATAWLARAGPDGDTRLTPLLAGLPDKIEGKAVQLSSSEEGSPLASLTSVYEAIEAARVDVSVTFQGFKSLYGPAYRSPGGTLSDPAEKAGVVRIVSTGSYFGLERTVEVFRRVKIVRPMLPVLGRFTLLAKSAPPGRDGVNLMQVGKRQAFPRPRGGILASSSHEALVLFNSDEAWAPGKPRPAVFDSAGWVFLGHELFPESRWVFNLSFGSDADDPFGEQFQLVPQAMFLAPPPEFTRELTPEGREVLEREIDRLAIKCGFYGSIARDTAPVFDDAALEQDPMRCASLHLYGSARKPSPTLVLGRAFRRYLLLSFLTDRSRARSLPLPFARVDELSSLGALAEKLPFKPPPGGTPPLDASTVLTRFLDNRPRLYAPLMSRVILEPYMRAYDAMEKGFAGGSAPDAFDPPFTLGDARSLSKSLAPLDDGDASSFAYRTGSNGRVKLLAPDGRALFSGDLDRLGGVDLLLPERVTYVFGGEQLSRGLKDGKLRVHGIMLQDPKEPQLVIDRPVEVEEGGVLVARGNILVKAPVQSAPGSRLPLTLVSLEGKIILGAERVDAALVALGPRGAIEKLDRGPIQLRGGIATTILDLDSLARGVTSGSEPGKSLAWDDRLDPVKAGPETLRLFLDTSRLVAIP